PLGGFLAQDLVDLAPHLAHADDKTFHIDAAPGAAQGGLLYLLWGDKRPAIRLRRRMEQAEAQLAPLRTPDPA
ncbi:hypothetical protein H6B10_17720, partial [Gemmiger formicilis]|uniref:hypothetical protein n=1 Tax=Gemmiger formicilis TaxID=745368 RepID=UPI00195DCBC0